VTEPNTKHLPWNWQYTGRIHTKWLHWCRPLSV